MPTVIKQRSDILKVSIRRVTASYLLVLSNVLGGLRLNVLLELGIGLQERDISINICSRQLYHKHHIITLAATTAASAEDLAKASFLACFFLNDSGTDDILYNTN